MADIDISSTLAEIRIVTGGKPQKRTGGEALDQGKLVYPGTDDKLFRGEWDDSSKIAISGMIVLPGDADGDDVYIAVPGDVIYIGTTLVQSEIYVLGTAGNFRPVGDLNTGKFPVIAGIAETTNKLRLILEHVTVAKP